MRQRWSRIGERLTGLIADREGLVASFLEAEQNRIARACHDMARRFARGGALIPFGHGAAATDAAHVAVEFMHPVIVGKRALPALAPTSDPTGASDLARLARADDIALGLAHGAEYTSLTTFLVEARTRGLMTIAMTADGVATSAQTPVEASADYWFDVPTDDPEIAQEVQETTYHVLWELVHVFFEHPGLLEEPRASAAPLERAAGEPAPERTREPGDAIGASGFLYPFLGSEETDLDSVLADVRSSTVRKGTDVIELRRAIDVEAIERCAGDIRERLEHGGRLIAFGNGGSSTDAQDVAGDLLARGWPAVALNNDVATITAVGNDVGYDNVFARQVIALGRGDDIGLAISTSGSSPNVIVALEEARRRRMLTIAVTGYDGGRCAELPWLDHLFVVESDYIPRLQEAHATIYHLLLEVVGGWRMR